MAAALYPQLRSDSSSQPMFPNSFTTDADFSDSRYPSMGAHHQPQIRRTGSNSPSIPTQLVTGYFDEQPPKTAQDMQRATSPLGMPTDGDSKSFAGNQFEFRDGHPDQQSQQSQLLRQDSVLSYVAPQGATRRVMERYGLSEDAQRVSRASADLRSATGQDESNHPPSQRRPSPPVRSPSAERPNSLFVPSPKPSSPLNPVSAASPDPPNGSIFPNGLPSSSSSPYTSPSMAIPISSNYRVYAQQPTYITPPVPPNPVNPVFTPAPQPQEEVCIECAMRDEDMADVDVTTPGVWDRESDVHYAELLQRELEDEANSIAVTSPNRPRARGGRLTEKNVKLWLAMNPREPTSRQHTIDKYIRSQAAMLEAEALAHARAMREAKQLDNRMKDAYSQLRRSAYDMGSSAAPVDDSGGVRIKPPRSSTEPATPTHARLHSREVTLLENGMIVEHVDVRKEEKEARERRRKEERRARKSSRSSTLDVMSVYSAQSIPPFMENGIPVVKQFSRYSQASSRPMSAVTAPLDRMDARALSQASLSDVHSLSSLSPRRRFFGFKNMSGGLLSQDSLAPSGMSGSMVDMHVALQKEASNPPPLGPRRRSQLWSSFEPTQEEPSVELPSPKKKKKKGLAKIWRIVTGSSSKNDTSQRREIPRPNDRHDDDMPLAPPPPLSYLLNRGQGDPHGSQRAGSTTSLQSTMSPRIGVSSTRLSPPTAPSSILPSPSSSKPSGRDEDQESKRTSGNQEDHDQHEDNLKRPTMTTIDSDPQLRPSSPTVTSPPSLSQRPLPRSRSNLRLSQDKVLPPIPPGEAAWPQQDMRPRTMYSFDPRQLIPDNQQNFQPPQAPFRRDVRRQSFNGTSSQPSLRAVAVSPPDQGRPFGTHYDEFGASRRSLGPTSGYPPEYIPHLRPGDRSLPAPSKRRSRFGLSSLFGKKSHQEEKVHTMASQYQTFPALDHAQSRLDDDGRVSGYDHSTSKHSAGHRSVTSRQALAELVSQDPDFIAYRYPSNDQRLDLLR